MRTENSRARVELRATRSIDTADQLNAPPLRSAIESVQRGLLVPCSELGAILKRNPEIGGRGRLDAIEALSGHADHGEWNAFYVNGLADGGGTAAEARGPVGIAENDDAGVRGLVFEREPAAARKGNAEPGKEVAADHVAFRFFGIPADAHGHFVDG